MSIGKITQTVEILLPKMTFTVQSSFARKELQAYASAGTVAEEVLSAIRTVFAFGAEDKEVERYERQLTPALKSGVRRNFMTGLGNGLMFGCLYGGLALGIWFGVKMIIESRENQTFEYTIGSIVIVFWSVTGAGFCIGGAAPHFESISVAKGAAKKVYDIIDRKPEIDASIGERVEFGETPPELELKDIQFCYPMRPEVKVLNGFCLKIKSGESVALVGPSGCGKSTIVQLIQRFYDPISGQVLINGRDIKELHLGSVRQQLGVVGQEPVLFDMSVEDNIRLGAHNIVSESDVVSAAKAANAHEFIEKLPNKYSTLIGSTQLSGGQKQRIAIARALVNRPRVLLLDEATSALDLQSESLVRSALERSPNTTTVIVAHRLTTVVHCDRIVCVREGTVVEEGSYSELMEKKGLFYDLWNESQSDVNYDNIELNGEVIGLKEVKLMEEEDEVEAEEEIILKKFSQMRLLKLMAYDKYYLLFGLFCSLLYGLIVPIYAFIFGAFVEVFATTDDSVLIWEHSSRFAYYYIVLSVSVAIISVSQITILGVAGERLTMRLRRMAFSAILKQEIAWFDEPNNTPGSLCARLSSDAAHVQGASGSRLAIICQALATFVTSAIVAFVLNWQLSAIACAFIPLILIGSAFSTVDAVKGTKKTVEKSTQVAVEAIAAIRTVASLSREQYFLNKYSEILESNLKTAKRKCILRAIPLSCAMSIIFLSYSVIFLFGGVLASKGNLNSGHFFIIIETLIYGSMTVGQSSIFTSDYRKAKIAAANIFRLIDRQSVRKRDLMTIKPKECDGSIAFDCVRFNYPNRPEVHVLSGLSFDVSRGQTVALVGASGCGKSTAIQLLEKFYNLSFGQISLDLKDINSLDTQWLRSQMALVSQEPNLFSYSIAENIAYGDLTRTVPTDEIMAAAEKANIHEFIKELPNGYDTKVGAKGTQLSGGQKQRIAIARALIRNPKILILDEATSALDTASEKVVQEALEEASKGRTCLVVAHRLTTIQNADKIIVIDRGVCVEEGVHEQLISRKGVYYNLYNIQFE